MNQITIYYEHLVVPAVDAVAKLYGIKNGSDGFTGMPLGTAIYSGAVYRFGASTCFLYPTNDGNKNVICVGVDYHTIYGSCRYVRYMECEDPTALPEITAILDIAFDPSRTISLQGILESNRFRKVNDFPVPVVFF